MTRSTSYAGPIPNRDSRSLQETGSFSHRPSWMERHIFEGSLEPNKFLIHHTFTIFFLIWEREGGVCVCMCVAGADRLFSSFEAWDRFILILINVIIKLAYKIIFVLDWKLAKVSTKAPLTVNTLLFLRCLLVYLLQPSSLHPPPHPFFESYINIHAEWNILVI